eukprot:TRINITY_DN5068_c0_g1_i1.p1 TRINITY_DN5068_c0_g1~~TRINITY_DN5068_c0_g1_i1.p1  ORF type:complete len:773 (-),score=250.38 TRINITY_DN5068_c0_g1_i1:17-2335(-)
MCVCSLYDDVRVCAAGCWGGAQSVRGVHVLSNEQAQQRLHVALSSEFEAGADGHAVVVYGRTLTAYTALQGLIAAGVPPSQIVHVQPATGTAGCINDAAIDAKVGEYVQSLEGVRTFGNHTLASIEHADGLVSGVTLRDEVSKGKVNLQASIVITSDQTAVDPDTFRAVIQSCLVYDGKLVIDSAFRTNDTSIYAFGGLAKFSRRSANQANLLAFEHYNSRELGVELAGSFLRSAKQQALTETMLLANDDTLVHKFVAPKMQTGVLPGGLKYFHAHVPGVDTVKSGRSLVTTHNDDYVCIHIDNYGVIDAISYAGHAALETDNFVKLIGLNEKFANNMAARYDEGVIPDFVSFFRHAWSKALFHDRFPEFVNETRQQFLSLPSIQQLAKQAAQVVDLDGKIDADIKEKLLEHLHSQAIHLVQTRLVEYLKTNHSELPMYYIPDQQYVVPPPPRPESTKGARAKLVNRVDVPKAKPSDAAVPAAAKAPPAQAAASGSKPATPQSARTKPAAPPVAQASASASPRLDNAQTSTSVVPPIAADGDDVQVPTSAPASARSHTSVAASKPATPGRESKAATPAVSKPTTPAASKPATPVASKPSTPVASTPAASKPATPAASKPATPAASKPTTPAASRPESPAASQPSTRKSESTEAASKPATPAKSETPRTTARSASSSSASAAVAESPRRTVSEPASAAAAAEDSRPASAADGDFKVPAARPASGVASKPSTPRADGVQRSQPPTSSRMASSPRSAAESPRVAAASVATASPRG